MDVLIQGAKAGQKQPKRPSIADDTIASISRLKALYLLSEGEIKGLANGAASIELEGTPLVDDSGNPNFEGVEWAIRTGTVDQEHIAGMPSASNEVGINTTLSSDTPYIRKISNTQLSSVNVNISFPLLKQVQDDGDVVGVTVAYAIDVQTDGMGYVTMLNTSLKAKTSGRYQKTHNIKLPEAQTSWQIRVRKITEDGNNETLFNAMQIDSMGEIIDVKLTYPCSALLYLSFDAKTFNNIPKIAVDTMGAYVQVPTNYDPVTRNSTGIWDGTFKLGYTTNPAWHHYNLVTNDRYGLGEKLQPFMIDKWALEYIARVCDEPVDDGNGGTEPRFTCNLYLQKAEDAYQVLQHIAGIFRGMSFWNGSQIVVDADTARDCEYVITRANVVDGAFIKTGSAASDRHTIAQVAYSNPANNYETDYAMVRNEQAIAQYGINVLDLSAVGCTSEGQAYRMGLAALLAETNRTQSVSFAMGLDGSLPSVASRIDIADMMFTGANTGGRISTVSANRKVITVDRDNVPVTVGDKLIVNLESGKAQERVITAINGRAITVALAFDAVAAQNVWAINSDTMPTMPFIVMSVVQNEDGTQYNYTAMQYDPTMYSQIDNGTIIEQRPTLPSNNPYVINAPESVTLTSRRRVEQGINLTTLVITWAQVKDAVAYDVEWRKDDGDWIKLSRTGNISAEVDGVYSGNYLARVRAVSAFDAISKPTSSMLTNIKGKIGLPPAIVGLKATGVLFGIDLTWGFAQGSGDSDYTEIQVGSAPDVNVAPLGQFSYPTNSHTINGLQGNLPQSYRARLVDKLGNKSVWSAWVTGTTDASADKIMDLIQGQIDESALDAALRSEIGKIDTNKTLLDNVSIDVSKAKTDIISAISKADAAKADAAANKIDLVAVNEAVANNKTAVDSSITTLTNKDISLTNLYTALQSEYATNKAKVTQDLKTLSDKDISLTSLLTTLDSDYKGNKATVTQSLSTLTAKDTALTNSLNSLTSTVGGHTSSINSMGTTIANNTQSIAQTRTDLTADFNSLEVGGRNLLLDSKELAVYYPVTTSSYHKGARIRRVAHTESIYTDAVRIDINGIEKGDYTVSFWAKSEGHLRIGSFFYNNNTTTNSVNNQGRGVTSGDGSNKLVVTAEWARYWSTYTVTGAESLLYLIIGRITDLNRNLYIAGIKVEKGNKASDWTEAPEDTDAVIAINTASISTEQTARVNADTALSARITENKAATDAAKSSITALQTTTANTNTALALAQTTLRAETANLVGAASNLLTDTMDLVGYEYRTSSVFYGDFRTLGVNGSRNSKNYEDALTANIKATGEYYVLSFYAKASAVTNIGCFFYSPNSTISSESSTGQTSTATDGSIEVSLTTSWKRYWVKWRHPPTEEMKKVILGRGTGNLNVYIAAPMLTEGTIAPAWTDSLSAAIQETKEVKVSVTGLSAQYTLKLDVGGRISGFGLMSSATQSDFAINADNFWIAPPTGSSKGKSPFMVLTTPQTINGTVVPAGTYIDSTFIHKAAIDTAQIKDAAIKTAQIDNLAVTTGKIANLAVDTLQIAGNAVTIPRVQNFTGDVYAFGAESVNGHTFGSVTLDAQGGSVTIQSMFSMIGVLRATGGVIGGYIHIDTMRNGVTRVDRFSIGFQADAVHQMITTPMAVDTPPTGNNTYSIKVWVSSTGTPNLYLKETRSIQVMGVKR